MNAFLESIFITQNRNTQREAIAQICDSSPMFDCTFHKVNNRQLVDGNGHTLYDFATQDYLGLIFRPELLNAVTEGTRKFGVAVPWCRLVGTIEIFEQVEKSISQLVGSQACSIFATTTLINHGVIAALLGKNGLLLLDKSAHMTMYEGAKIARDSGSLLVSFPTDDLENLEALLLQHQNIEKKLICVDGVNSMTGGYSNLPALDDLAKKYNALLYVDDAHGFGVVGEKPDSNAPFGYKGNGLVKYFGLDYSNIIYVGCFSKAYGSSGAFVACSCRMRDFLISQATPHDLGASPQPSAMSAIMAGLNINAREGEAIRKKIWSLTQKVIAALREMGFEVNNTTGFPILSVKINDESKIIEISEFLYNNHVFLTLSPYPMVKKGHEALRITITAANTEEEINQLIKAFCIIKNTYGVLV